MDEVCGFPFAEDVARLTRENTAYRKVVYTDPQMQLVLMSIEPTDEGIEVEVHEYTTQFFLVEAGRGTALLDGIVHVPLSEGTGLIVPARALHEVLNTSETESLKIYTIYCPPVHPPPAVCATKARAQIKKTLIDGPSGDVHSHISNTPGLLPALPFAVSSRTVRPASGGKAYKPAADPFNGMKAPSASRFMVSSVGAVRGICTFVPNRSRKKRRWSSRTKSLSTSSSVPDALFRGRFGSSSGTDSSSSSSSTGSSALFRLYDMSRGQTAGV